MPQFEKGKVYCGASLTGLNLSYSGSSELNLGLQGQAGYLFADNLMAVGNLSYQHTGKEGVKDYVSVGVQADIISFRMVSISDWEPGLAHTGSYNDVMPGLEVGYAFFVSRTVTIEPAVYYDQSFKESLRLLYGRFACGNRNLSLMEQQYPSVLLEKAVGEFAKLPGIGP